MAHDVPLHAPARARPDARAPGSAEPRERAAATACGALPEIVLISAGEIGSGALEAHLGELARRLSPHARVSWAALASPRLFVPGQGGRILRRFADRASRGLSGRLIVLPHAPRFAAMGLAGRALGLVLRAAVGSSAPVLHARGYVATLAALAARSALPGARVLHDVRGDRPAEVRQHGGEAAPGRVAELEAVACRRADAHLAVSGPLRDLLRRRHAVESSVLGSAADTDAFRFDAAGRARVRASLGLSDEPLLGFIGSCAPWQRPDALASLFHALARLRPRARLVVVSPDHEAWAAELARHGIAADTPLRPAAGARAFVRAAPHEEMPAWISACDATALLRDDDDVNRVASPIKFGESLACGVPVLMTDRIGDASALAAERGLGACFRDPLLRDPGDADLLRLFLERLETGAPGLREACREAAVACWSWEAQLPERLRIYAGMALPGAADRPVTVPMPGPAPQESP